MEAQLQDDFQSQYHAAPVVAQASAQERAAFITKTYLHLLGAIVAFTFLEVLWFATPVAPLMIQFMTGGGLNMLLVLGAFIGVGFLANNWAMSAASLGKQYAGLALYTVAESLLFLPLIWVAWSLGAKGEPGLLSKAVMITLTMFGSLTGIVFVTRKDFSFMRGVLIFAGFAAMGLVAASLIFGFTLGMVFSYAMIAFACGYILYDTSNVMLRYRTSQHVAAALALFASVMLLFWYVLRILISRRN
ncbi:MAG TPA: Bax inhibitor-1 family protein [Polyangiales bacterium]|nr:Bax inhibitor-1 family protein [Polyangiales bacterium]